MTDFSFKDEDEKPASPSAQPTNSASTAQTPTAPTPNLPLPTAPTAPSPPLPPTTQPPGKAASKAPQVPTPQVPVSVPSSAQNSAQILAGHFTSASETPEILDPAKGDLDLRGNRTARGRKSSGDRVSTWYAVLDWLTPLAFWILRGATLFGGVAIAYLLWGVLSGGMQGTSGNAAQTVQNVESAILILSWSLLGIAVSCFILLREEKFVALITTLLGVLLYFGAAPLLRSTGDSIAIREAAVALQRGALPLLILGGLKYAYDMMQWITELPNRMRNIANVGVAQRAEPRQQREAQNAHLFSPCWKLPFCREVIRKQCPAYLARRTCWKFGRGCYCDEEMISRIIRGESLDNIKAPTRMSRQGKPPCGRCYIFLEHQGLKYKAISPLAIPATLAIVYFGWNTYLELTDKLVGSFGFIWNRLAFQTVDTTAKVVNAAGKELEAAPSTLSSEQIQSTAQTMFGVLLGFALLIYMSKAIEWAIYKAKL